MIKWIYQEGSRHKVGKHTPYPKPKEGLIWIFAVSPTEKELSKISKDFHLPPTILRNYPNERRSVRYSFQPFACTFVDYEVDKDKIKRTNVLYFVSNHFIITILQGPISSYDSVFVELSKKVSRIRFSVIDVLTEILDTDIEENYDVLEEIENEVTELEREIATKRTRDISRVVDIRRNLNRMSRAFWGSSRVTYFLKFGLGSLQPTEEQMTKLDDLHESVIHQLDMISNLKEMLTDIITIHQTNISNWLAIISNRINSSIKLLTWIMLIMTGLTLVLTVPNTMATIFGIPYFGLSSEASHYIAAILVASLIVPIIIFLIYWKSIRRKALEVERQNV
jgi:Mg2+ and Co2+ transporter CorA